MSPVTRRRSARLANTATPKSKSVAPALGAIDEKIESPVRKAPESRDSAVSPLPAPATPASTALRPPNTEMHPSKFHSTTLAPSSALRLGFTDIKDKQRRDSMHGSGIDSTPTKMGGVPSSSFTFRAPRPLVEANMSSHAQKIMEELRGEAAKIKADLLAQREADQSSTSGIGERAFAKPKSKAGRFSAAHMAEFKKMDSIEGHASAWRAQIGRHTPVKSLKRTPSKAELDTTPTPHKSALKQFSAKSSAGEIVNPQPKFGLKRKQSITLNDTRPSSAKKTEIPALGRNNSSENVTNPFPAKRLKQQADDDASTARPVSRDGSSIPQPKLGVKKVGFVGQSGLSRLMSPTKSLLAQAKTTMSLAAPSSCARQETDVKAALPTESATTASEANASDSQGRVTSPSRFQRVKSILRGQKPGSDESKSGIPQPVTFQAQTPALARTNKALPPIPLTTPRRKMTKHVTFTPETVRAAVELESPSPQKSRSSFMGRVKATLDLEGKQPARHDGALADAHSGEVAYPDLSGLRHLIEPGSNETKGAQEGEREIEVQQKPEPERAQGQEQKQKQKHETGPSVPGMFTFRSDHTIKFGGASPSAFGAARGQASIRHVRDSVLPPSEMPGSFPDAPSPTLQANKENAEPSPPKVLSGALHGMSNKKRQRTGSVDSDAPGEGDERASKKRKQDQVAGGETAATPRPLGSTPAKKMRLDRPLGQAPSRTPGRTPARTPARIAGRTPGATPGPAASATPGKKRAGMSMDRLNMLARPKHRA